MRDGNSGHLLPELQQEIDNERVALHVGELLGAEIPPAANQFDHLGLAAEGIWINRAFMLAEETDDRRDVGRDRRVDAEQIGDREVPAILAVPPGQKEVCDPA